MNRNRSFGSRVTITAYRGMNGLEMKELLDRLKRNFTTGTTEVFMN